MSETKAELLAIAKAIRYDLTACQGKLSALMRSIADADLPDREPAVCPTCGARLAGPVTLAEHVHTSHGGPVPPTWERAEALSD